jgi:hypothetical protein
MGDKLEAGTIALAADDMSAQAASSSDDFTFKVRVLPVVIDKIEGWTSGRCTHMYPGRCHMDVTFMHM